MPSCIIRKMSICQNMEEEQAIFGHQDMLRYKDCQGLRQSSQTKFKLPKQNLLNTSESVCLVSLSMVRLKSCLKRYSTLLTGRQMAVTA